MISSVLWISYWLWVLYKPKPKKVWKEPTDLVGVDYEDVELYALAFLAGETYGSQTKN